MNPVRHPFKSILQSAADDFKFSKWDLGWFTTLLSYAFRSVAPYRTEPAIFPIPAQCKLAIVGDWGTGSDEAVKVLDTIKTHKPDIFYHLGDIYYSGTKNEVDRRFLAPLKDVNARIFSLMGNHDAYSGGHAYYDMVDKIGQQSCHFVLDNGYINLVGLNTGWSDNVSKSATIQLHESEAEWARRYLTKKSILFSHHQPFSGYQDVSNVTRSQLGDLRNVAGWFVGHDHRLTAYEPFVGVERLRVVGAGAIPIFLESGHFDSKLPIKPITYGDDGFVYKHSFAIMELDKDKVTVRYLDEDNTLLFTEAF